MRQFTFLWCVIALISLPSSAGGINQGGLYDLFGKNDAVTVTDGTGKIVYSKNGAKRLMPASTLKILTSLVALHHLGPDYRFITEFYLDENADLTIKGYGDPLLVSEALIEIAAALSDKAPVIRDILLDDSHFVHPLTIPGVSDTTEPYDAPNGALCVNFNTVSFRRKDGVYVSGEAQTPLLPFALEKIEKTGKPSGRITLSHQGRDITKYAGLLMRYFMEQSGITVSGSVKTARVPIGDRSPIYTYRSTYTVAEIIEKLLTSSNNFMANQLLIASGVHAYGAPGDLVKGVKATLFYASGILGIKGIRITEGSGISRGNRLSSMDMVTILHAFEPYRQLLRRQDRDQFKTGSLSGVKTRAGFIDSRSGKPFRYSVIFNTNGRTTTPAMEFLLKNLE